MKTQYNDAQLTKIVRDNPLSDQSFLQSDLDEWLVHYNNERTSQGVMNCGRPPM
ncbi:hypothetical protein CHS65_004599 [Salmonella enterica]|uniref:Integrase catalytic domain-containing protein n=1 Tax=Salmonella enterica TaxID=28901 RepID=A0A749BSR6_SALER|nr:hypothetical protein [Salmonella enterica]EDQ3622588.1 hypothetical protein [Salmonella enterica subsp. diarizonae]EDS4379815.1 hypothetical protein [Salmonella enterica subsp. diarizonae serovar 16:z10:e,n,x,z15]EDS4950979.1 hypothetical protein [Salmonella enterica subsp. enterica serovar Redlands]EDT6429914.1 hypothetical protein [Salmonella enterica subsp. enterica]EDT6984562.1 hypothetical protein [Salmonella enterica subsp. arizonae]EDW0436702.1 hypothetical protein [Salmonella enter